MAITEVYVDPSLDSNSGAGTSGDPYGDYQYCFSTGSHDTTNGTRVNVKAGTAEDLAAALDLSGWGTPTADAPLLIQGYTSVPGDGGIAEIDGGGSYGMFASADTDFIAIIDMKMGNSGSATVVDLDNDITMINCEIHTSTGIGIDIDSRGFVGNCYVHDVDATGIDLTTGFIYSCYIKLADPGIVLRGSGHALFNVITCTGASDGVRTTGDHDVIMNNTMYSTSGTGEGVNVSSTAEGAIILNNYAEGFSGIGGYGAQFVAGSWVMLYAGNRYYNNTSNEDLSGTISVNIDNSAVGSSALANPGSEDFSVNTDLKAGAWPGEIGQILANQFFDIGALQREEPGGGGGLLVHPGMSAGMRG